MKKIYQSPSIFCVQVQSSKVISVSVMISGDADIGLGRNDIDGTIIPEVKEMIPIGWDDMPIVGGGEW